MRGLETHYRRTYHSVKQIVKKYSSDESKVQSKSKYFDYDFAPTKTNLSTLTPLKSIEVAYLQPKGLYIVQRDESFLCALLSLWHEGDLS